jgi:hypothetical protein
MGFDYSATNLLTAVTLVSVSTENTIYPKENLYDDRPSKPFYWTSKLAQEIIIDLGATPPLLELIAIFNHTLMQAATITVEANNAGFPGAPLQSWSPAWREYDFYFRPLDTFRYWRVYIDDPTNPLIPRIGELWLGSVSQFIQAYVQDGQADGKTFHADEKQTGYGQDWDVYFSEQKEFKLQIKHVNDPAVVDEIETFLTSIAGPAGRFVLIPDTRYAHVYFVKVVGSPAAQRPIYGDCELREWALTLRELTRGITLL